MTNYYTVDVTLTDDNGETITWAVSFTSPAHLSRYQIRQLAMSEFIDRYSASPTFTEDLPFLSPEHLSVRTKHVTRG